MLNDERGIGDNEIELIRRLLDYAFPGDPLFSIQIDKLEKLISFNDDNTILRIAFSGDYEKHRGKIFRPNLSGYVEASGIDSDGGVVNAMLWITDGEIKDLEFLRPDAEKVQCQPKASDLYGFQKAI
ncbi:hypothetical protein QZM25_31880 [Burkholderia contaminans]|uniref:hypothetical protein n=1 Tax=Burkholderia cepacia complex TaxID=87882 RepID=UPI0011B27C7E|nr:MULTISPECIES: hypothetical protein [Burkholderia cepacia complex]MDN7577215.1 hypothetical protein [Burkholderia contaminans]